MNIINTSDYSSIVIRIGAEDFVNYCDFISTDRETANLQLQFSGRDIFNVSDFNGLVNYDVPASFTIDIDLTLPASSLYKAIGGCGNFVEVPVTDYGVYVTVDDVDVSDALVDSYEEGVDPDNEDDNAYSYCIDCVTDEINSLLKDEYEQLIVSQPCYICFKV